MSKLLVLMLAMSFSYTASAGASRREEFCVDMAGMSVLLAQVRDKGIDMMDTTFALQNYLDEHPEFPATGPEKDYALKVLQTVYKMRTLSGDTLGDFIFRQCKAEVQL
jgi:hypothetical protein